MTDQSSRLPTAEEWRPFVPIAVIDRTKVTCSACGVQGVPQLRIVGPHLGAYCTMCSSHIQWVQKKGPWRALASVQGINV